MVSTNSITVMGSDMEAMATAWVLVDMAELVQVIEASELVMAESEVLTVVSELTELATEESGQAMVESVVFMEDLGLTELVMEGSVLMAELALTEELEVMELATELTIRMRMDTDTIKAIPVTKVSTKLAAIKATTQPLEDTTQQTMLLVGLDTN